MNKIKLLFLILKSKILCFPIVRRIFNEARLYEGPLKTIEKGFKPFWWWQSMYGDSTCEIMKLRVGFRNITVLKFDMEMLYEYNKKGDKVLNYMFGPTFSNFGISGGVCATNGFKFLWINTKFICIDSKLFDSLNEENKRFFLLHELGHCVLGHFDGMSQYDTNGNVQQLLNYEFEDQADAYARGYVKPKDPHNAIDAFLQNKFCDHIFQEMCDKSFMSYYDFRRSYDAGIFFEIERRFKGEKFNPQKYAEAMVKAFA